jgi:dethiobiotin synthetase
MTRPRHLIAVVGTHTEVGKTWVAHDLLRRCRALGLNVAARKPVQSFEASAGATDAERLAAASGEHPHAVCPAHRWYPLPMAPPMAADALGRPRIQLSELVEEITWPEPLEVGLVETVGGVRSPIAHDGDSIDLVRCLQPDRVLLIADAGLGTLNAVRLALSCLDAWPTFIFLNRFDPADRLHHLNRKWLAEKDGVPTITEVDLLTCTVIE